jgi:hypothetical protein
MFVDRKRRFTFVQPRPAYSLAVTIQCVNKTGRTTINRVTEISRLDESGRDFKREMRDEVEPFDLQRGDDS